MPFTCSARCVGSRALFVLLVGVVAFAPRVASAQTPLPELILRLLLADIVLAPPTGPFPSHEAHFTPLLGGGEVAPGFEVAQIEIPLGINATVLSQLSTIPLGSTSGGFAYTFDPALGTFTRQAGTFGSLFGERALTIGRGRWNVGFNFQRATYDTLEGKRLRDGQVKVYLVHQDIDANNRPGQTPLPFFEGDLIENTMFLGLTSSVLSVFTNYGFSDRLDIGVVVPVVTVLMDLDVRARIIRLATEDAPTIHSFDGQGSSERAFTEENRAQGLGDIVLRGKYRMFPAPGGGLAAGLEVRLPTGDSRNLLGSGATQTTVSFIGSMGTQKISPHVNVGYTFSAGERRDPLESRPDIPDEFRYTAGLDAGLAERLTLSFDVLGRTLRDTGRLVPVNRVFPFMARTGEFGTASFEEFTRRSGNLDLVVAAAGVRFNPRGNFLISAYTLVPLTDAGLRDRVTPVVAIDYVF
jgi:hypothetical protein